MFMCWVWLTIWLFTIRLTAKVNQIFPYMYIWKNSGNNKRTWQWQNYKFSDISVRVLKKIYSLISEHLACFFNRFMQLGISLKLPPFRTHMLWNRLPCTLRVVTNHGEFKSKLVDHIWKNLVDFGCESDSEQSDC